MQRTEQVQRTDNKITDDRPSGRNKRLEDLKENARNSGETPNRRQSPKALTASQRRYISLLSTTCTHGAMQLSTFQDSNCPSFPVLITLLRRPLLQHAQSRRRRPRRFWQVINVSSGRFTIDSHPNMFNAFASYCAFLQSQY
jgi:hypothetical protein